MPRKNDVGAGHKVEIQRLQALVPQITAEKLELRRRIGFGRSIFNVFVDPIDVSVVQSFQLPTFCEPST
jgi:hypothetical protein